MFRSGLRAGVAKEEVCGRNVAGEKIHIFRPMEILSRRALTSSILQQLGKSVIREFQCSEPEKLNCASGFDGRDRALRGPRPRAAGGTNGTTVLDLAKSVPRLHGAVTAQRAIPTNFGCRVELRLETQPLFLRLSRTVRHCFPLLAWMLAPFAIGAELADFNRDIRPILAEHCFSCHGPEKQKSGLRLDQKSSAFKGGESGGPALVAGRSAESELIKRLNSPDPEVRMPKKSEPLRPEQIALLKRWIDEGAHWFDGLAGGPVRQQSEITEEDRKFWAFQPVRSIEPPKVNNQDWPRRAIDRFILAKLEEKRLTPSRDASKLVLLRRLTFDLIGLPPAPEDMEAFQRDDSPVAVERVVDRLLGSKEFGERWGRHWLDVARYADSNGSDENFTYYDAWRFRNYVIDAFNKDKAFDQFVREQIAGDLLPSAGQKQRDEQITATGFLVLGPKVIGDDDKEQLRMDVIDEQIDTVGKAFLGLSLGCARCHDHKFDPVPTRDYYALAGIFGSTETVHGQLLHRRDLSGWNLRPLGQDGEKLYREWMAYDDKLDGLKKKQEKSKADLASLKKKVEAGVKETPATTPAAKEPTAADLEATKISELEQTLKSLATEIKQLSEKPAPKPSLAMAVCDREAIADARIFERGDMHRPGEVVPRGFIQVANYGAPSNPSPAQSGRLELAEWLVDSRNPLTARVMANRIWHHLFGTGLVRTVDDFGRQGERPSHPELLDYLAGRFMAMNWSCKQLIREIVLSRVYQLSSEHSEVAYGSDPENRLLWRMNRRRLEVEALRDSVLAISGQLDPSPAESVVTNLPDQATGVGDKPRKPFQSVRRSVYLPVIRNDLRPEFQILDFADPQTVSGRRNLTTVAPQSLFLMNSQLLRDSARSLAVKLSKRAGSQNEVEFVREACREILGRSPSPGEIQFSLAYLAECSREVSGDSKDPQSTATALANLCQALMCSSQFLYVD
jgi:hypothetical protein